MDAKIIRGEYWGWEEGETCDIVDWLVQIVIRSRLILESSVLKTSWCGEMTVYAYLE